MSRYTHASKIGNQGDLVKHFVLASIIRGQRMLPDTYTYLDVHAGRSDYALHDNGEWEKGIGDFSRRCESGRSLDDALQYYLKLHHVDTINKERKYYGSSKIVRNTLIDCSVKEIEMYLCDTSDEVWEFPPGAIVKCKGKQVEGKMALVAIERS